MNDTFSFCNASSSTEARVESSNLPLPMLDSFNSLETSSLQAASFNASEDSPNEHSFIVEVTRPLISVYGPWASLGESEVMACLARYGQKGGKQSFWHSLSLSAISGECHEEAIKFLTSEFGGIRELLAAKCYAIFNKTLFKGMLPRAQPEVKWAYCGDKIGNFRAPNHYCLAIFFVDDLFKVANVMLHLMCFAAVADLEEPALSITWGQWTSLAKSMFPELVQPTAKRMKIIFHEIAIFQYKNTPLLV